MSDQGQVRYQPDHDLAELRRHWSFAYLVTWEYGMFRAVRHQDGSAVSAPTAAELEREMQQDYRLRPTPLAAVQRWP